MLRVQCRFERKPRRETHNSKRFYGQGHQVSVSTYSISSKCSIAGSNISQETRKRVEKRMI